MKLQLRIYLIALVFIILLGWMYVNPSVLGKFIYPIYYKQEIHKSAANFEVDPLLIAAIIRVESNFKHESVSNKGALGIMQLMPDTAAWINSTGFQNQLTNQDIGKVDVNIDLGTWYVKWLQDYYKGDIVKVISAYNAGQGNVDRWVEHGNWYGQTHEIESIPFGETRHFVQRVLYYYQKYQKFHIES